MHENGRLYFEGNAGKNAPANMKNAPAAIKTGVPAAAGLPGPQERKYSLGRWTLGRIAPFGRCLISCIYCANALSETDVPAQGGSKGRSPPGNHVQDAPYITGCDLTVPQFPGTVNQIQKETSAVRRLLLSAKEVITSDALIFLSTKTQETEAIRNEQLQYRA